MNNNLCVLLIAHNEEATIEKMIDGLLKHYPKEILEILVVDDASTDNTASLVESRAARCPKVKLIRRTPPCGVGRALQTGFDNISPEAEYCLTMDSDFVENILQVNSLILAMDEKKYDGVIGSRFVAGGRLVNYPFSKKVMNRLFHCVVKILFGVRQNDLTNNFKLYKTALFKELPWKSTDFAMNAETGLFPILMRYNIQETPIVWVGRNAEMGKSKFSLLKFGRNYLRVIFYAWQLRRNS